MYLSFQMYVYIYIYTAIVGIYLMLNFTGVNELQL